MRLSDDITFSDAGIQLGAYPFAPASLAPGGLVRWPAVQEVVLQAMPPEIWTRDGDILFVPATRRVELAAASRGHSIAHTRRIDVWDLILEPFLDTTFDEAHQQRTLAQLGTCGIDPELCARLRREVEQVMVAYNFASGLWDWVHLGLYDLLCAYQLCRVREFDRRYREAVAIARRGRLLEAAQ